MALRRSRLWVARIKLANAQKNQKDVLRSVSGIPWYALNNEQQVNLAITDSRVRTAKKNLKQEQKRATNYARAVSNWKKLLRKTRA